MKKLKRKVIILIFLGLALPNNAHTQQFPQPMGAVNDFAGVIPASFEQQIDAICNDSRNSGNLYSPTVKFSELVVAGK